MRELNNEYTAQITANTIAMYHETKEKYSISFNRMILENDKKCYSSLKKMTKNLIVHLYTGFIKKINSVRIKFIECAGINFHPFINKLVKD